MGRVGRSSASKMLQSIFMKGFVVLLLETIIASNQYGVEDDVLTSSKTLEGGPFYEVINNLLTRELSIQSVGNMKWKRLSQP